MIVTELGLVAITVGAMVSMGLRLVPALMATAYYGVIWWRVTQ